MKHYTEGKTITQSICPSNSVMPYEEKVYTNKDDTIVKANPYYILKQKVLNIQNFNSLICNYTEFFENYKIFCVFSVLNVFIILFLLLLYLLFSLIIFLPVFFLLSSLFFCFFPLFYPLIRDKTQIILKEEIIFCTCITIGSLLFFISILFIYLTPFVSVFLYPFNAIFMPLISTLVLPLILFTNSCICTIYIVFYTEISKNIKNMVQNASRHLLFKFPLFYI
ncbi:conserved Plasmodium protein, unknown function [Plasmodium malariae]|uniref:Uncharacterized protein n=1 Tax=Plasmodium malariae TaxID=5858 RepID=A0A1D3SNW9_PLAMA|nr:conserved Plasmodium protein, unknown function [Plasmodium malariae]SCO93588.1 conserved Plasmodium protein, unknown function [Plasmodium malariae]